MEATNAVLASVIIPSLTIIVIRMIEEAQFLKEKRLIIDKVERESFSLGWKETEIKKDLKAEIRRKRSLILRMISSSKKNKVYFTEEDIAGIIQLYQEVQLFRDAYEDKLNDQEKALLQAYVQKVLSPVFREFLGSHLHNFSPSPTPPNSQSSPEPRSPS